MELAQKRDVYVALRTALDEIRKVEALTKAKTLDEPLWRAQLQEIDRIVGGILECFPPEKEDLPYKSRSLGQAEAEEIQKLASLTDPRIQFIQATVRRMLPEIIQAVLERIDPNGPWKRVQVLEGSGEGKEGSGGP